MDALLARIAESPEQTAIVLDVDGTLAPIVPRPEDAAVPEETRSELRRLAGKYAVVGCITGRSSTDARRIVGLDDLVYIGLHGLELAPDAERWRGTLHELAQEVSWPAEDKGLTVSFHYRQAHDEAAAREHLEGVAHRARELGLKPRWGRKVLEVVPPVVADKGTAIRALLADSGVHRALYAGDDTTDIDAFRALAEVELGVRIAVASAEAVDALREAADIVVADPAELLELLRCL